MLTAGRTGLGHEPRTTLFRGLYLIAEGASARDEAQDHAARKRGASISAGALSTYAGTLAAPIHGDGDDEPDRQH
jgi:hypothetical protein